MVKIGDAVGVLETGLFVKVNNGESRMVGTVINLPKHSNFYRTEIGMGPNMVVCVDMEPDWAYIEHIQGYEPDYRIFAEGKSRT